jgi:hypothetical protein
MSECPEEAQKVQLPRKTAHKMSSNIFMCYMIHKDIFLPRRKMRKY